MKRQWIHLLISKSASRITKFTRGPSVASYLHEKQTSRIQSLNEATEGPHVNFVMRVSMRNKEIEINPYIYTLSKLYRVDYEISVFTTNHPVINLRASLFVVTLSHVASSKIGCQSFSFSFVCPFDYTAIAESGKVGPVNQVNHTSWVAVVSPTDRHKSVHNRV